MMWVLGTLGRGVLVRLLNWSQSATIVHSALSHVCNTVITLGMERNDRILTVNKPLGATSTLFDAMHSGSQNHVKYSATLV